MVSRHLTSAATGAAIMLVVSSAWAQPTAADRETARSLMQEGRELRDKGDLQGALKRFQAADGIMHVPTTGFEVARTQVALGQLIEARDTIATMRKTPAKPGDPEPFVEARTKADELDSNLEGRIPALTIVVEGAPEGETPTISIDGVQLPSAAVGLPRKVDPGHHTVSAKAGSLEGSQDVDVREKEQKQVQVSLAPGSAGTPPMGGEPQGGELGQGSPGGESENTSHAPGVVTWIGGGVGVAGVAVGAITGLMSMSKTSSLNNECPGKHCPPGQATSDLNSAQTLATVSTVSFIVGGVGAAVAIGSLVIGHGVAAAPAPSTTPPETPTQGLRVTPWIGLGSAGLRGTF